MIKCSNCGASYYRERYKTCTAMYFPPIYKDGININPDKNITTVVCQCINCQSVFSYRMRGDKLYEES